MLTGNVTKSQARALKLLAANSQGMTEGFLLAHDISIDDMVELVNTGLATARGERVRAGSQQIEVARLTITDAEREAIA
jgi:hypothetical protein